MCQQVDFLWDFSPCLSSHPLVIPVLVLLCTGPGGPVQVLLVRAHQIRFRSTTMALFYLSHLFKGPVSKQDRTQRYWWLGFNIWVGETWFIQQPTTVLPKLFLLKHMNHHACQSTKQRMMWASGPQPLCTQTAHPEIQHRGKQDTGHR